MSIYRLNAFDEPDHLTALSQLREQLEKPRCYIDFERFREKFEAMFCAERGAGGARRKPYHVVLMSTILTLPRPFNLSNNLTCDLCGYVQQIRLGHVPVAELAIQIRAKVANPCPKSFLAALIPCINATPTRRLAGSGEK